jgi:uncharacterized membrane protein YgdD (TMEM256/DUF423 family)
MILSLLAALSAAIAIAAGAFGAHGAASPQAAEYLRTGGMYQLIHAVAVVALSGQVQGIGPMRGVSICLLVGAAIFATSLYAMAFGASKWLGAVTPIGGTLLIVGWLWAAFAYAFPRA